VRRPPFLDILVTAPRWQKLALGLVGLAAFSAAGYAIAIAPVNDRVAGLRVQRDTQQRELVRLRALAVELTRVRREAADVEARLERVTERLPSQREIPALYRTLSDAAVQAGLAVALFQPREPRIRDFYSEIPIAVVAEGGYHELGDFIGRVSMLPRATTIGELRLSAPAPDPRRPAPAPAPARPTRAVRPLVEDLRFGITVANASRPRRSMRAELTVLTFVYRPVGSPPAPKPAGPGTKAEAPKP